MKDFVMIDNNGNDMVVVASIMISFCFGSWRVLSCANVNQKVCRMIADDVPRVSVM